MWAESRLIYLVSSLGVQASAPPTVWNFESGSQDWQPNVAQRTCPLAVGKHGAGEFETRMT